MRKGTLLFVLISIFLFGAGGSSKGDDGVKSLPPQGLYDDSDPSTAESRGRLDKMAKAGFKLVVNYGVFDYDVADIIIYADHANAVGMKVIWDVRAGEDGTFDRDYIRERVEAVKTHPATWGYYVADEPGLATPNDIGSEQGQVKALSNYMHKLDPAHPRFLVHWAEYYPNDPVINLRPYADYADVIALDVYALAAYAPAEDVGGAARAGQELADEKGKQWAIVLQSFDASQYKKELPDAYAGWPDRERMIKERNLALKNSQPVFILWYSYFDILRSSDPTGYWADLVNAAFSPAIDDDRSKNSANVHLKDISGKVLIGSYIENKFSDTAYANLVAKEFSAGQSTWYAAWGGWQSENSYDFADFNAVVNWLRQNGISTHMHMLVGPNSYMPEWLLKGQWTNDQLDALLKNMIYSIMDANDNKNKVDVWNVVNEAIDDDGLYVTEDTMIWNQLGWELDQSGLSGVDKINTQHPVFIRKAFQYARDKTKAKLEYRDYYIESNNPASGLDKKHKAVYQLLKHMLNSGIPVDAVGIQGHHDIGNVDGLTQNNELQNTVQKFKALGLEVYITEMDIGTAGQTWNDTLAIQQATDYYNYLRQAINGGVNRIYIWGIADGSDPTWRTNEHPLPWDKNYKRKPAYDGIVRALKDTK